MSDLYFNTEEEQENASAILRWAADQVPPEAEQILLRMAQEVDEGQHVRRCQICDAPIPAGIRCRAHVYA